jgi:phosphatase NudJ
MRQRWKPSVTVAALIEQGGRFLLVEEHTPEGLRLNNPAGHLDPGESLVEAVVREALEETTREFTPKWLVGVYLGRLQRPARNEDVTYLRVAIAGEVGEANAARRLDHGIVRTLWLTPQEIEASQERHRSPLVWRCVQDHLQGPRLPLSALVAHESIYQPRAIG